MKRETCTLHVLIDEGPSSKEALARGGQRRPREPGAVSIFSPGSGVRDPGGRALSSGQFWRSRQVDMVLQVRRLCGVADHHIAPQLDLLIREAIQLYPADEVVAIVRRWMAEKEAEKRALLG